MLPSLPRFRRLAAAVALAVAACAPAAVAGPASCDVDVRPCSEAGAQCGPFPLLLAAEPVPAASSDAGVALEGATVTSADGAHYRLEGDVRLQRGAQILRGSELEWQRDSGDFSARGDVHWQNERLLLATPELDGNTARGTGTARAVDYQFLDDPGNGHAAGVELLGGGHSRLTGVAYSTCSPAARSWELRARRVDLDGEREVGYARNATLRLGRVPILWLPWVRFPTSDRRQSGLLYPTIGYNDNRGFDLTVPWYLNLAPNVDATLYPRSIGRRGFMLGAELRYLTRRSRGALRVDHLAHDRRADRARTLVRADSRTRLPGPWRFDVHLNHVSDRNYFEDLGDGLYGNATQLLHSDVYLDGRGERWHARIGADQYQITDPELPAGFEPYKRLPRATFSARDVLAGGIGWGVDGEFVSFHKRDALDGRRLDVEPWIDWRAQGPWWYVNPRLSWRHTAWQLDRDSDDHPTRSLPITSVDAGLVFERGVRWFGENGTQTLEPRLFYLYVPWRDQTAIPIFDTSEQTFDYWQLFSRNRFSGPDRQMDANDATLALTSRVLDAGGVERMAASIGRIRHFDPQRVQLPGRAQTDRSGSAWVAQASARLGARWQLNLAQQWDPDGRHTDLSTVAVQHTTWRNGVLNMAYRYRRGYLEQVDLSTLWPVHERWNLVARWNWALDQRRTLEALAGLEYANCCVAVRLLGRHYVRNSGGELNNSLMLEIEFKGIGSIGQPAENLLRHAILGYQPGRLDGSDSFPPQPAPHRAPPVPATPPPDAQSP